MGQSSPPPGHEGGQAHVGKAHDPLRLGLECTPNTWAPSQPLSSGHHLLSWSQILDWELLLVLGSMLGNWWLDGRTSFAIVRSDGWTKTHTHTHTHIHTHTHLSQSLDNSPDQNIHTHTLTHTSTNTNTHTNTPLSQSFENSPEQNVPFLLEFSSVVNLNSADSLNLDKLHSC